MTAVNPRLLELGQVYVSSEARNLPISDAEYEHDDAEAAATAMALAGHPVPAEAISGIPA